MSSNTPHRASHPAGKPRPKDVMLDLTTARQMLPLVRSIVRDIVSSRQKIAALAPEQERLSRRRRELLWPERQRRYQLIEELAAAEQTLNTATEELSGLGVKLVDGDSGAVDFPTRVNGRPAAFTWRLGEDGVRHWHYQGEEQLHPIPREWDNPPAATTLRFRN